MKNALVQKHIHRNWWTALIALPTSDQTPAFNALRRVWADPTINTVIETDEGELETKRNRGFYREDSEDHLMVCLFENWAALPTCEWASDFLAACGAEPVGEISGVGWSYEYTQDRPKKKPGKLTADIVVYWKDQMGDGVLVLECKKPGNRVWSDKDMPSNGLYLDVPGFDDITRKYACLLISEDDRVAEEGRLGSEPVITWENLAEMQMTEFKKLHIADPIKAFMVGALVHQYASYNILAERAPYQWMHEQPSALELHKAVHDGKIRRSPLWKSFRNISECKSRI